MNNVIEEFLKEIGVDENSINDIVDFYHHLETIKLETKFLDIIKQYDSEFFNYNNLVLDLRKFEKNNNLNIYKYDLLFVVCLFIKLKDLYIKNNLPLDIYWNTAKDVKYKIIECRLVKNVTGTFVIEWYMNFFTLKRFGIGRLQYELTEANFEYQDENISISSDDKAIAIHIPRSGESFSPEIVNQSIKQAIKFCKADKPLIFKCESWLLFPKTVEMAGPSSNIYHFYQLFNIIKTYNLENYSEMWRLFDCEINDIDSLPEDSSLRKKYKNYMQNNERIGVSLGFFVE